jgi:hypothetical protein
MKSRKASKPKSDPPAVLLSPSDPAHLQRKMQEVQLAIGNGRHCGVIAHTFIGCASDPRWKPSSADSGGSCGCLRAFPIRTRSADGMPRREQSYAVAMVVEELRILPMNTSG